MILDYERRLAYVHIPRTAGTSITYWYARYAMTRSTLIDLAWHKHATASDILAAFGPHLTLWTVWRPLPDIRRSLARLARRDAAHLDDLPAPWRETLRTLDLSLPDHALAIALWPAATDEDTWRRYWLGDHDVHLLRYDHLADDWTRWTARADLPRLPLVEKIT